MPRGHTKFWHGEEGQAFLFHLGVLMAILTDGRLVAASWTVVSQCESKPVCHELKEESCDHKQ